MLHFRHWKDQRANFSDLFLSAFVLSAYLLRHGVLLSLLCPPISKRDPPLLVTIYPFFAEYALRTQPICISRIRFREKWKKVPKFTNPPCTLHGAINREGGRRT